MPGNACLSSTSSAELVELRQALPGIYSSAAATPAQPSALTAGDAVTLSITPVEAQLIGDAVFFVRETAAAVSRTKNTASPISCASTGVIESVTASPAVSADGCAGVAAALL